MGRDKMSASNTVVFLNYSIMSHSNVFIMCIGG